MWVPLFIKEPGQRAAKVDDHNWEHVDLLPTLADYAGVRLPWPVDGRSALRGEPGPRLPSTSWSSASAARPGS
jgi:arylsulfatase A-like enzyme